MNFKLKKNKTKKNPHKNCCPKVLSPQLAMISSTVSGHILPRPYMVDD